MGSGTGVLTRDEALTLLGMLVVIASLFLVWAHVTPRDQPIVAAVALYRSPQAMLTLNGFQTHVWLPLTLCATVCSSTLLCEFNEKSRRTLAAVQMACALACLSIALTHMAPLPGALGALCGSALLVCGAIERLKTLMSTGI